MAFFIYMTMSWQCLEQFLTQHQITERPIVVALSGGVDSVALLQLFVELRAHSNIQFSAIHVNHGLSSNALAWQQQTQALCDSLDVNLQVCEINLNKSTRQSLEQVAREGRYIAIAQVLPAHSVLFTGHHQSDQVETLFLRLLRGAGLTGLASMKPLSSYPFALGREKSLMVARPLLSATKSSLQEYCVKHDLAWVEDESNQDDSFDRNFVRNQVVPLLQTRWPQANKSISDTAGVLQQELELLNEYVLADLFLCLGAGFNNQPVLKLTKLLRFSKAKQAAIIRAFIYQETSQYPTRNVLTQLIEQQVHSQPDRQPCIVMGQFELRIHNQLFYIVDSGCESVLAYSIAIVNKEFCLDLMNNQVFEELQISGLGTDDKIDIRFNQLADKLKPNKNSGSKKVKEILKEQNCPPWLRSQIPLIYLDDKLIAIANLALDYCWHGKLTINCR